ncbi:MAG: dihydroorotase [Gammaproteobacteria bacterium]|nr:dihydroorotase [Gammaproteobacteria bacterium]
MKTLTIIRPDDWHLHLRDGPGLAAFVAATARQFARAIVMPNLVPPVTTTALAAAYRERILAALPADTVFEPLMTLYLTDHTSPEEIRQARASGFVKAVKYYPAGATTHSDSGVTRVENTYDALEAMAASGLPLLVHGEVVNDEVDIFDRERVFIDQVLEPLTERFPTLKVVLEHVTTKDAVGFVKAASVRMAATITVHHLMLNRNAMFKGGMNPHHYCLPVLKREIHRQALLEAAVSGHPRFFLGTDSAPHPRGAKEGGCGCAGIFSAPAALELYAEVFDEAGALDRLEGFASRHGPAFYGLPVNADHVTLVKRPWKMPATITCGTDEVVPLRAGGEVHWSLVHGNDG